MFSYENWSVDPRKVQCPECGRESISRRGWVQCSVAGCRHLFLGNDCLVKTPDDRLKERQEMDKILEEMKSRMYKEKEDANSRIDKIIEDINRLKQKLKPLSIPSSKKNTPESTQQVIIQ